MFNTLFAIGLIAMPKDRPWADNPYFCILPWIHLYVMPNNEVFPCCYGGTDEPVGNLLENDLDEIANSDGMKKLRRNMLAGKPSRACRRCYKAEVAGFRTLRQNSNAKFAHHLDGCLETREDGHIDQVAPRYLDARFSNICNLKCRFCWHNCSSSWYEDYKFISPSYKEKRILRAGRSEDHLWAQVAKSLATVEDIYFAGGEPLLMAEHYRILNHLTEAGRFDVSLAYTTNLSVLEHKGKSIIDYWQQFQKVQVGVSLDGLGRRAEYIRSGLDWETFLSNLRAVRTFCPHVKLNANLTISIFNIFELIAIYEHFATEDLFRDVELEINFLDKPEIYAIQVLPAPIRAELSAELLSYAARTSHRKTRESVQAVVAFLNAEDYSHLLGDFFKRTDQLDHRREECIDEIIPEIGQLRAYLEQTPA